MQSSVRRAVFAGSWYPARASECERQIKAFIDQGPITPPRNPSPVGGVVPHAGWTFSGSIACNVIHYLTQAGPPGPDAIVLFGMHLHRGSANIMMPTGGWETPFGVIPVQEELAAAIAQRFAFRLETPARFTEDNTIELQLPFIKHFFPDAAIVAMGVPPTRDSLAIGNAVVDTARQLGLSVKVIGSTDLTHYGDNYGLASHGTGPAAVAWVRQENDRRVIEAMLGLDPERVIDEALKNQNACCPGAAATAIQAGLRQLCGRLTQRRRPGPAFQEGAAVRRMRRDHERPEGCRNVNGACSIHISDFKFEISNWGAPHKCIGPKLIAGLEEIE